MQEVWGSNPGAAPPTFGQFGAQIHPHTPLKIKEWQGLPEEGEIGAEGLWFRRAQREAKKKINVHTTTRHTVLVKHKEKSTCIAKCAMVGSVGV